jgi:hypothetical protein
MNRRNFIATIIGSLFLPNISVKKLPEPVLPALSTPGEFMIDYTHPLAKGLVFASFGR